MTEFEFILPGIPPTGKHVEIPIVVLMHFKDGKVSYEHLYWDKASALVQVGLLLSMTSYRSFLMPDQRRASR
jgi:carboxymethylenebutenolidase